MFAYVKYCLKTFNTYDNCFVIRWRVIFFWGGGGVFSFPSKIRFFFLHFSFVCYLLSKNGWSCVSTTAYPLKSFAFCHPTYKTWPGRFLDLSLFHLHSVHPVSIKFSRPTFLSICPISYLPTTMDLNSQ